MTLEEKLKEYQEKIKQNPLTSVIITIALLLLLLIVVPYLDVSHRGINNATVEATLENQSRATLAQILGGVAIGIGLYYTWRRIAISEKELKATQKSLAITQKNLKVAQEGQITERFTRAIDQLGAIDKFGNPALEIRLGGIYALERIANESDKDYWPIMEILTAYVRKNSSIEDQKVKEQGKVQFDIQAILSVIKKRNMPDDFVEPDGLSLQDTYLCKANLSEALLERANIQGANLKEADFTKAHLERADLYEADLTGANLTEAHLEGANLVGANLTEAHLEGANLEGADFTEINFEENNIEKEANFEENNIEGANLKKAYLCEANLKKAYLCEANLEGANLVGANLIEAHLEGANLRGASFDRVPYFCLEGANLTKTHLCGADLTGTNFEGANVKEADFEGANLEGADFTDVDFEEDNIDNSLFPGLQNKHNLTIDQLSKAKTLYQAELDPELEEELRSKGYSHLLDDEP